MSSTDKKIKAEILKLYDLGEELYKKDYALKDPVKICTEYQSWYTRSLIVIKQILPYRIDEFTGLYITKNKKISDINALTFTISDYLMGIKIRKGDKDIFDPSVTFQSKFVQQITILKSALDNIDSILSDIKGTIQADLFDNELDAAKELLKQGHLRAAGALAGVTLERHLYMVINNDPNASIKKSSNISTLNNYLRDNNLIDIQNWRFIQLLADIRNRCVHNSDFEPTKQDVIDLICGVEKIIKTIH